MRDTELYRHLLGIEAPWTVGEVELSVEESRVDVFVVHADGIRWPCPECGADLALYDHSAERVWRHLDSCQFKTFLHARPPRVNCPTHGVRQVKLPWAETKSRFTAMFERLAIDVLRETDVTGALRILRLSWDEAWHIMERAVARGLGRKGNRVPVHAGVDEKAAAKGHRYLTLVSDLKEGRIEYIGDGRKKESLDQYFAGLKDEQRARIEAMALDMWEPFILSCQAHLPEAKSKMVFDRFHIMQHMGDAVDEVRKEEHRTLLKEGNDSLTGTKYLWLYRDEHLPERHRSRFEELKGSQLKTARAWAIKESLAVFWDQETPEGGARFFKRWFYWATHSRLAAVVKVARMLKRHLQNVLTYFVHRITNAVTEGLNSKIQTIKKMAYGFRNPENFKTAIFFHCGGLNLYPATHGIPG
jgi:transposase